MRLEACEILTTGWCPNSCKYCYIPKTPVMRELHEELAKELEEGTYLERLRGVYGDNLTSLSFWGTEPTLTLDLIRPRMQEICEAFPKLKEIQFSTSLIEYKPIARLLDSFPGNGIKLGVQISLDGPAFISDKNRFPRAAEIIPSNFLELVSSIQGVKTKVEFHWKVTLVIDNIKEMNDEPSKIKEFSSYFENLADEFDKVNHNDNITLNRKGYSPTLAVPGKYTSEDGKIFAQFLKYLREVGVKSTYTPRMERLVNYWDELGTKRAMFTCSGGDSNIGLGRNLHLCHRSFYLDEPKYIESVLAQEDIENWDTSNFKRGGLALLKERYIVDPNNKLEMARWHYVMRNYHDFWRLKISYAQAMLIELALCGQASKIYIDNEDMRTLFALFINTALSCPMENILNVGNIHFTPLSTFRMFGNGAFEEILNDATRGK